MKPFLISCVIATFCLHACKTPEQAVRAQLIEMELNRSKAIAAHDTATLDQFYANDFRGVTAIGYRVTKSDLMQVFKRDNPNVIFTNSDHEVRILNKTTALLTGKLTGKTNDGKVIHESVYIHVLVKRNGKWQIVAGQGTNTLKQ
jgi:hypothetical protein